MESKTYRMAVLLVAPLALLALGRCATTPTQDAATVACTAASSARCAKEAQCAPFSFQVSYGADTPTCVRVLTGSCLANLAAPGNTNTAALLTQCAQDLAGESCQDDYVSSPPASCVAPAGPRATGTACAVGGQCASQVCLTSKASLCGVCSSQPAAGASCAVTGCGSGLVCDADGGTCLSPTFSAGSSCSDSAQCGAGYACVGDPGQGQCVLEKTSVGADCSNATDGGPCAGTTANVFCDTKGDHTCQLYTWAAAGAQCGYLGAGVSVKCASEGTCVADGGISTCVPPAAVGGACDTVAGPACIPPLRCILTSTAVTSGTCQSPDPASCQ